MKAFAVLLCGVLAACARSDKGVTEEVGQTTITSAPIVHSRAADFQIARRVERALASDFDLSMAARNVEVNVNDGVVTLTGSVDDQEDKNAVGAAADSVLDRNGSLNKIDVSASRNENGTSSDENIAYMLQRSLHLDPSVAADANKVTVEVVRGQVTFRGTTNPETRDAMEVIAQTTPGVVAIANDLQASIELEK